MSGQTKGALFAMMEDVLVKVAASKKEAKPEGDGSEPTAHPSESVDAGTIKATEGARSAENVADVKKEVPDGCTGQEDANTANSLNPSDTMGTISQSADEVKGNVQDPKAEKDDPEQNGRGDGSPGHPSNLTFNEKYSAAKILKQGESLLAAIISIKSAEEECSENAVEKKTEDTKTEKPAQAGDSKVPEQKKIEDEAKKEGSVKVASEQEKKAAAEKYTEDAEAGYMAAQLLANHLGFGKEAEDQAVVQGVGALIKKAEEDADLFCSFVDGHARGERIGKTATQKRALGEMGMGGAPMGGMGGGGEEIPPEMLAALAGGGAGPEAGMAPGMEPGMEPGMGGEGGASPEEEAILAALAQAMEEEGVTPEQLVELVEGGGMGGEGGMEGGMGGGGGMEGGMPPEIPAEVPAVITPGAGEENGGGSTESDTGTEGGGKGPPKKEEEVEEKTEEKEGAARFRKKALHATLRGLMRTR